MSLFDRYILNQILPSLGMTLLVALSALLAERMLRVLDMVLGNSGPLHYVARMLTYLAPHYLGLALPFAFFLAILLTFNRLSRDSEFDAFLAAGVGLHQLIRPLLFVTFGIFLIALLTFNYLQPHARYAYRSLVSAVKDPIFYAMAKEGVFITDGDVTYLVEEISADKQQYGRVFMFEAESNGQSVATTAERGVLDKQSPDKTPYALLYDGVRLAAPLDEPVGESSVLRFGELHVSLGDSDLGPFRPRGRDEREFTLLELWELRRSTPEHLQPLQVESEFHARVVRLLSILALPFLAVSLALGRQRSSRFYGVAVGGAILICYHEFLQFGERNVARDIAEPWLALWTPLAVFLVGSGLLFYRTAFRAGQPLALRLLDRLAERLLHVGDRAQSGSPGR